MIRIHSEEAFRPGAELWIVGPVDSSSWTLKVDWFLNFVFFKHKDRKMPALSVELTQILNHTGLPAERVETTTDSPCLTLSQGKLPCRWVLFANSCEVEKIKKIWLELGQPSTRVFGAENWVLDHRFEFVGELK